jgi:hypothetical protein
MTRTIRIYNLPHIKKAQRPRLVPSEFTLDGRIIKDNSRDSYTGFPFAEYGQICMGRCRFCRDPHKDQIIQRKRRKSAFLKELKEYFCGYELPEETYD